jgi:hypothetical protein
MFFKYLSLSISVFGDCVRAEVSVDFAGFWPAKRLNPACQSKEQAAITPKSMRRETELSAETHNLHVQVF